MIPRGALLSAGSLVLLLGACTATRTARQPAPPPAAPIVEAVIEVEATPAIQGVVWTAEARTTLRTEAGDRIIPHPFTRLYALGSDSLGLQVECTRCPEPWTGWLDAEAVVFTPGTPEASAYGRLAEFVLAVQDAALRRDLDALGRVMSPDFTFTFGGGGGPQQAFDAWRREGFRTLDHLAVILDRGLATRDGEIWSAPPEFVNEAEYLGMRAGFRRVSGRWQWLYFVGGD